MVDTSKQERSDMEEYLITTFSRIKDEYGQQLDVTLALPTLIDLIEKGGQDDSDKVYVYTLLFYSSLTSYESK